MTGGVRLAREREQLVTDGFCVVPGVLDAGMLASLRRQSSALPDQLSEEEKRIQGGQGAWQPIPFVPAVFARTHRVAAGAGRTEPANGGRPGQVA